MPNMRAEANTVKQTSEPLDFRDLIETIPALVACALPDGSIEFANRAWLEYTGGSLQQSGRWAWQDVIHAGDIGGFLDQWSATLDTGKPFETEARIQRADGQYRWFLIRKALAVAQTPNGQPSLRTLIACEDIHDRKREESARRDLEERYRVVVETASDAVICMEENGRIEFANAATERVFGYKPAELIGKPTTVLMPEAMRKAHDAGFNRYLATGEKRMNWGGAELTAMHKNGQEFPVEVSFAELLKDGRRIFTGFVRDISERKQAQEAQQALQNTQLELARVSRFTTMGELAASIAHEVNQPLTAVTNNGSACLRLLANHSLEPEVLRRALEEIVADSARASAVIARIRAFIRKTPGERNELDVNEVIREVLTLAARELDDNRVVVDCQLTRPLPLVCADRIQLQQVLLNLIMNGIEAMTGVTTRPRLLSVRSGVDESGEVLVAVHDSGTGLGPEAERVFTPFFTTKAEGMGMGLPISRSLIEGHGGRLWAETNLPHGAAFSFTLPVADGRPS